ncbi:MAG: HAMP domain-containing histidine kinase [Christensenellaceae bacterium]|jgi:signal transduction histidine kinase|nr:HAMP domain-containing histidine kinase [Christensenellaceae bacterium]
MRIRVKIFGWLLAFCAVLLVLLWLFQIVFLDSIYRLVKIAEVHSAMNALSGRLGDEDLSALAESLYESRGVSVVVLSPDGTVALTQGAFPRQRELSRELSRLYSLTAQHGGEYFEYPSQELSSHPPANTPFGQPRGQQEIYHCRLVDGSLLVLFAMISPVDATVSTLKIELYFISCALLLFSLLLAFLIARHVARPIVSIHLSAQRLARGEYDTVFSARGYREIRELSDMLNAAARELSTVDGLRRTLVANVSHDLRTPLTLIAGYAEAMRDLPGENTAENAQIIVDEANRLSRLVSDVLDLSKLQAGALEPRLAPFALTQCLRGIVARLSEFTRAEGYGIALEADEEIAIAADESLVSQALYNLLINAIHFTGDDKMVVVRQIAQSGFVTVEVADSGPGISPGELPHIWERYHRGESKRGRPKGAGVAPGTGLGLAIVKSIVDLHGGQCGVRSAPDKGSVFWVQFKR